jgi:hypothetical protein
MADRGIIMGPWSVLTIREGRRVQTRRLLRIRGHKVIREFGPSDTRGYDWHFRDAQMLWHDLRHADLLARLYYRPGDRLWVKEDWSPDPRGVMGHGALYRLGHTAAEEKGPHSLHAWRSARHMPRWASRATLTVTEVRIQRLQELSETDAEAEGLWRGRARRHYWWLSPAECRILEPYPSHVAAYGHLWTSLHSRRSWDANPWVVAITFTPEQRNIDDARP